MTIPDSTTHIFCQTCGRAWEKTDTRAMERFQPRPNDPKWASPADIVAAAQIMIACPADPIEVIDESTGSDIEERRRKMGDETDPRRPPPEEQTGGTRVETHSDEA